MSLDPESIRRDFPIFETEMQGRPLCYLDSAASAQKPRVVIEAVSKFFSSQYANIHRGVYRLSAEATRQYEGMDRCAETDDGDNNGGADGKRQPQIK